MELLSINTGIARTHEYEGHTIRTAIFKHQRVGPVVLTKLGVEGDEQADPRYHGGHDKAVFVYPHEHYEFWAQELRRAELDLGTFGENLTVQGLLENEICIGDRLKVGDAILEVSQPRTPCSKLALRLAAPEAPRIFSQTGRCGFYARVVEPGTIEAGMPITRVARGSVGITVSLTQSVVAKRGASPADIAHVLSEAALSAAWRADIAKIYRL